MGRNDDYEPSDADIQAAYDELAGDPDLSRTEREELRESVWALLVHKAERKGQRQEGKPK